MLNFSHYSMNTTLFIILLVFFLLRYISLVHDSLTYYSLKQLNHIQRHPNRKRFNSPFYKMLFLMIEYTVICSMFLALFSPSLTQNYSDDISDNINIIADSLAKASKELSSIQQELEARIEFVEDLKRQAEIAENVISLSEEQVNAVQAKLSQELEESSGRDTLISILINIAFLTLGLVLPQIIKYFRRERTTDNGNPHSADSLYTKDDMIKILEAAKESIEKADTDSSKSVL